MVWQRFEVNYELYRSAVPRVSLRGCQYTHAYNTYTGAKQHEKQKRRTTNNITIFRVNVYNILYFPDQKRSGYVYADSLVLVYVWYFVRSFGRDDDESARSCFDN